ncbi:MAG: hypothetical protein H0U03_05540, partial [Actinobacteria bacterium]|nr:hypothetical protein [Actinomycetota bacterium]
HGERYASLALPGTAARDLLVPAGLALFFAYVADPRRSIPSHTVLVTIAAAALALALVHPTYALFVAVPLVGFWIVRGVVARAEIRPIGVALGGLLLPAAAVFLWLLPIVRDTASHRPEDDELRRALAQYAGQVDVLSERSYRLAPEVFGRSGAVAIAALCLIPLAALALRRRWAAFVLGGSLAVLAIMLTPLLFSSFADAVSLSQARRAAGFLPFAFAFAGGVAVLTRLLGSFLLPVALAAGIALQLAYPGDFAYRLEDGGPAVVTWFAALGGAGALIAVAVVRRRPGALDRRNALVPLAAALFVLPVAVHGLANWDVRPARSAAALTAGLERAVRTDVPEGDVVFSDLETSYRLAAAAPVYIAAAPPGHVADTVENRPYERREDVRVFLRTGDLAIPRRYRARWIVVDRNLFRKPLSLPSAYADARYVLYRLR